MSFGIESRTSAGGLAITTRGAGLHYIGRATYIGMTQLPGGGTLTGETYDITYTGPMPAPFIIPQDGHAYEQIIVRRQDSATWRMWMRSTATPGTTAVYCFGELVAGTGPAEAWGARVFDPSGNPLFDTTRGPLNVKSVMVLPPPPTGTTAPIDRTPFDSTAAENLPSRFGVCFALPGFGLVSSGMAGGAVASIGFKYSGGYIQRCIGFGLGGSGSLHPTTRMTVFGHTSVFLFADLTIY